MKLIVNSDVSLAKAVNQINNDYVENKWLTVTIKTATRLDIQNRWVQQFYNMVSKQSGQPRQSLMNHCKYYHGMPILLLNLPDEAALWRKMMLALTEEERLAAMTKTPVTSLFGIDECSDYIEQLINHFDNHELPQKDWDK